MRAKRAGLIWMSQVWIQVFLVTSMPLDAQEFNPEIKVEIGDQQTILADGNLNLQYFPDGAVSILKPTSSYRFRMLAPVRTSTYLIEGDSLHKLVKATEVLKPGNRGSFDNGYAGISAVYRHIDGKLYGFYHAEDQENMPAIGGGVPGFYCSIGVAISDDEGRSWQKLGQAITSAKPKSWTAFDGQSDRGAGEVSVAASTDGQHLLAYYTEHSRMNNRGVQICMARAEIAKGPPVPGAFMKYYDGEFRESAVGGLDSPVLSAIEFDGGDAIFPQVSYSKHLGVYVMVLNINVWKELAKAGTALERSGIYIAYSQDGLTWTTPQLLIKDYAACQIGKSVSWHPTIIWNDRQGKSGHLVYSHTENWGHSQGGTVPHYMVARTIQFVAGSSDSQRR